MRRISFVLAVVVFVSPGAALAQSWIEYVSSEDHFLINFPGEPTVRDIGYEEGRAELETMTNRELPTITARLYSAERDDSRYALTVVNYSNIDHPTTLKSALPYAILKYRQMGEVTYDMYAHIDRVDGHQLQITRPDGRRLFVALHFHYPDRRLYILEAEVPADETPPALFQVSLQFLDQEGNSIRYQIDDAGNATRTRRGPPGPPAPG